MTLESQITTVGQSASSLFKKLENPENLEKLMPENLEKFNFSETSFSFALKGMPEIFLEKKTATPYKELVYGAAGGKIPFNLTFLLETINENTSSIKIIFEAGLNPMMAMMVKNPVSKLIQTMSEKTTTL